MSNDLPPLSENAFPPQFLDFPSNFYIDTATVERKLSQININNFPGPKVLPNWFLRDFTPVLCQQYLMSPFVRALFHFSGRVQNVIPIPKVHPPLNIKSTSDLSPLSHVLPNYLNLLLHSGY